MQDSIINGNGDSRYLKTSLASGTTWAAALSQLRAGTFPIDLYGINSAGFSTEGTPLTKANLLSAATEQKLDLADATPNEAFDKIADILATVPKLYNATISTVANQPYTDVTISGLTSSSRVMTERRTASSATTLPAYFPVCCGYVAANTLRVFWNTTPSSAANVAVVFYIVY